MALVSVRDRLHRVRVSLGLTAQAAIAAGLAWYVAHNLLHHVQPFFAPIAAVVVLAISVGQRLRRAIELVAGNAVGILLGEVLIFQIGRGAWQVSLVVFLAIMTAIFVGGSAPLITQAAASASLVATLIPLSENYLFSRFVDAVVGGVIGVGVMALLLPLNPLTVVQRGAGPILEALADGLAKTATALEKRDAEVATAALEELRETEAHLREYSEAIKAGQEIANVAPLRWRSRGLLGQYLESYPHVARALRNTRVLTRRTLSMISDSEPVPEPLVEAVNSLAESVSWLRHELASEADPLVSRTSAQRAVAASAEAYRAGLGFSGSVVVAQIRSIASDLIAAGGEEPDEVTRLVRSAGRRPD
ncbi:MAG TPA: FUSC family protein [Candidatus Limnocylindrales bacterium]